MWFHGDGKGKRILGNLHSWRVVTAYRLSHSIPFFNRYKSTRETSKPLSFNLEAPDYTGGTSATVIETGISLAISTGNESITAIRNISISETGISLTASAGEETLSYGMTLVETGNALTIATGNEEVGIGATIVETGNILTIANGNETVEAIRNISITETGNALIAATGSETVLFDYSLTETGIELTAAIGNESITGEANVTETGISLIVTANNAVVTAEGGVVHANVNATGIGLTASINSASVEAIKRAAGAIQTGKGKKVRLPPYPQWYPMREPKPLRQDVRLRMESAGDLWIHAGQAKAIPQVDTRVRAKGNKTELRINNVFMITSKNDSDRYWQHRRRLEEEEIMRFLLAA